MASTSRRSLKEKVLAVFGGKKPTRQTCSSCNDLLQEQRVDETGLPVPVASANFNIQSATLPSTSRPTRFTSLSTKQVKLADKATLQKSSSLGSFHHGPLSANIWSSGRFQDTPVTHSELDRSTQMQQPTTDSKNSSVRYKKKRTGGNISVPNMSTEENCSLMDTLCSEENRSSQMFDSSLAILDGHSESTTPLTSGKSCLDSAEENGAGQDFGMRRRSPSRKISCDQRSVGVETDAVCDKDEDSDAEKRDLQSSQGAKTIIQTADTVIKIFDSSLSIKGRFKEVVVHINETKAPRRVVADVATSTDTCNTQHDSSQPQHAAIVVRKECVDVGVGTSLPESCTTGDVNAACTEDATRSAQLQSCRLEYRSLISDDDGDSIIERHKNGLTVAKRGLSANRPAVDNDVLGSNASVATVISTSRLADVSAATAFGCKAIAIRSEDCDCIYSNTLDTTCDNGAVSMPNTTFPENEQSQRELQTCDGVCANSFIEVCSQRSVVPPETISRSKTYLPGSSTASLESVPACGPVVDNVDPKSVSDGQLLETVDEQSISYGGDNNAGVRLGDSERDKCDGATSCEDTLQSVRTPQVQPVVTGEACQQDRESVAVPTAEKPECEGSSGGLDLDECQVSPAADSSTIVDNYSPESPLPGNGTPGKHESSHGIVDVEKVEMQQGDSATSSGSLADECGLVDAYNLTRQVDRQTGKLNKLMDKYRSRTRKVERLLQYLNQLSKEKDEMCRLLQNVNKETAALRLEAAEFRCTVSAVCNTAVNTIGMETEARRLEPNCYRRYTNIRTAADASNALAAVRSRIKALNELEVLVYRKQLMLNHILPSVHQDAAQPAKTAGPTCKHARTRP
ncbi:hypothetical protein BsWGS_09728 [Bradybaena similaris]